MRQLKFTPICPDVGRIVIVESHAQMIRSQFLYLNIQLRFTRFKSRTQIGIDGINMRILFDQFETILQGIYVQRFISGSQFSPLFHIAGTEPFVPGHIDLRESAFDDFQSNHTIFHLLIRNHRAGSDIAVVNVKAGDFIFHFLKLFGGDFPVFKRRQNRRKVFFGKYSITLQFEFSDKNFSERRQLRIIAVERRKCAFIRVCNCHNP